MKCRHCGRPLSSEESRRNGAGHRCRELHSAAPNHPELFETVERQPRPKREPEVFDFDAIRGIKVDANGGA